MTCIDVLPQCTIVSQHRKTKRTRGASITFFTHSIVIGPKGAPTALINWRTLACLLRSRRYTPNLSNFFKISSKDDKKKTVVHFNIRDIYVYTYIYIYIYLF